MGIDVMFEVRLLEVVMWMCRVEPQQWERQAYGVEVGMEVVSIRRMVDGSKGLRSRRRVGRVLVGALHFACDLRQVDSQD